MNVEITLRVDGRERRLTIDTRTTLLDAMRERLGITSPKKGCDHIAANADVGTGKFHRHYRPGRQLAQREPNRGPNASLHPHRGAGQAARGPQAGVSRGLVAHEPR